MTGPGSVWQNSNALRVGGSGFGSTLTIADGGAVSASEVTLGSSASSSNNLLAVNGGSLISSGDVDVRRGAVMMDSGTIKANSLTLTNGANGTFQMSGGTLAVNTLANDGSGNVQLSGGTLQARNANGNWSAAMNVSSTLTIDTADADGTARNNVISGNISGGGTVNVTGAGRLSMNGTVTDGGLMTVQSGSTLGGNGTLADVQISADAMLAAGNSIDTLTMENLLLEVDSHIEVEINATTGTAGVDWDWINVIGETTLNGISDSSFIIIDVVNYGGLPGTEAPLDSLSWIFLTSAGGITGFDADAFVVTTDGLSGWTNGTWSVSQIGDSLQVNYAVPEPVSLVLVALGGLLMIGYRRFSGRA